VSIAFLEGAEYDYEAKRRPSRQDLEQRIAELTAALADSQAYNQHLVGQLAKKQNENNQLQERLEAAMARIKELETQVQFLGDRLQSIAMTDVDVATGRTYSEGCKL
jgi:septal ring factor EnvC (AmiA/AmiB activator)